MKDGWNVTRGLLTQCERNSCKREREYMTIEEEEEEDDETQEMKRELQNEGMTTT